MAKSVKGRIQAFFATSSLLRGKGSGVYIFIKYCNSMMMHDDET